MGRVAGFENFELSPEALHGYTETLGDVAWATANVLPDGEKATPDPVLAGNVDGLLNLVPKPEPLHGYTDT